MCLSMEILLRRNANSGRRRSITALAFAACPQGCAAGLVEPGHPDDSCVLLFVALLER